MPRVICKLTFPDDEPYRIRANAMVLARHYAKKAVKAHWQSLGHKLRDLESDKLYRDANSYLGKHPELIALATERYLNFVESSRVQRLIRATLSSAAQSSKR